MRGPGCPGVAVGGERRGTVWCHHQTKTFLNVQVSKFELANILTALSISIFHDLVAKVPEKRKLHGATSTDMAILGLYPEKKGRLS